MTALILSVNWTFFERWMRIRNTGRRTFGKKAEVWQRSSRLSETINESVCPLSKQAPCVIPTSFMHRNYQIQQKTCIVYLDDIMIYSHTIKEDIDHVDDILNSLKHTFITLKIKMYKIFTTKVKYLKEKLSQENLKSITLTLRLWERRSHLQTSGITAPN